MDNRRILMTLSSYLFLIWQYFKTNFDILKDDESTSLTDKSQLQLIAQLLQITEKELTEALTGRVLAASGEVLRKVHKHKEAEFGRDAFAKVNII